MAAKQPKKKQPECGAMVDGGMMSYPCAVEGKEHEGPCAAVEVPRSQRARERWAEGERAKATLAGFQGEAQTTAERNTENPTPVPTSKAQRTHERDDAAWAAEQEAKAAPAAFDPPVDQWRQERAAENEKALAAARAHLVEIIGEESVLKIEAGVEGGMAAAAEVLAAKEREQHPRVSIVGANVLNAPPTKTRPEDQRLPVGNDQPVSHDLVAADLAERLRVGISRYGQPLQALNGRNALQDGYEEILDLSVYLRTLMVEREVMVTLAATLKNRLGYLQVVLADLQVEAHATYDGSLPLEDSPVDTILVHDEEMEAIDRILAWLQA